MGTGWDSTKSSNISLKPQQMERSEKNHWIFSWFFNWVQVLSSAIIHLLTIIHWRIIWMEDFRMKLSLNLNLTLYLTFAMDPDLQVCERREGESSCLLLSTSSTWPITRRRWRSRQPLKVTPSCLNPGWGKDSERIAGSGSKKNFSGKGNWCWCSMSLNLSYTGESLQVP